MLRCVISIIIIIIIMLIVTIIIIINIIVLIIMIIIIITVVRSCVMCCWILHWMYLLRCMLCALQHGHRDKARMGDDRNVAHWHIRLSQGTLVSLCIAHQHLH